MSASQVWCNLAVNSEQTKTHSGSKKRTFYQWKLGEVGIKNGNGRRFYVGVFPLPLNLLKVCTLVLLPASSQGALSLIFLIRLNI